MRSIVLIFVSGCCLGCGDSVELASLKASLRITGEEVVTKQDESLTILREQTTALAAIKSQVENVQASLVETRQAVGTMEAKLVVPQPQVKEVIKSALEPQEKAKEPANTPPSFASPAVRSSEVKMSWNVEGNWNPSILETARHLRKDHGIIADGMSHQQMHDAHAALHEGRTPVVAVKSPPVQIINRGTSCPNGVCPTRQTVRMRWRR